MKVRSFKNYTKDLFLEALKKIEFPDYSNFDNIDDAYCDFTEKVIATIDKIAPIKERF